ncbi:unnamed protein product [Enterobius vermicularis]|uniref:Uncharacterized protein n=1 Tax=Enterobius vermicularis TaxID=51028 RepID=A0A0N4V461_ENTVE|nr:unnamed protein product [Enterobius vermicularis]
MGHVVVEGVPVPAAIASSFSDPKKRPFSYTEPLPPTTTATAVTGEQRSVSTSYVNVSLPKVLPIVPDSSADQQPSSTGQQKLPVLTADTTSAFNDSNSNPTTVTAPYTEMPTNLQYNTPLPIYSR